MKILIANYRYFFTGGPERYMFNVADALTTRGHRVIPFSIRYNRNLSTPYEEYFVEPLGSENQVYFRDQNLDLNTLRKTLSRLFYAKDVETSITELIKETKPQIAYVLHYLRKLSPSLLVGLHKAGLPIVVRLSDYMMVCPQAHCLRDAQPCELCVQGNLLPSIRHKCVQSSFIVSTLNGLATWYHRYQKYFDLIDIFVTTNQFMSQMLHKFGISPNRITTIPTYVDQHVFHPSQNLLKSSPYITYVGRLEETKGVHILLKAWGEFRKNNTNSLLRLKIVGNGNIAYTMLLKQMCSDLNLDNIEFLGECDLDTVASIIRNAFLSIIPSLWYENLPNSLLESFASGTPVITSDIGSLSESMKDGEMGYLFEPGNHLNLAERINYCYRNPSKVAMMSKNVTRIAELRYSPERHLVDLETLFKRLLS